jgi:hypothetical protein
VQLPSMNPTISTLSEQNPIDKPVGAVVGTPSPHGDPSPPHHTPWSHPDLIGEAQSGFLTYSRSGQGLLQPLSRPPAILGWPWRATDGAPWGDTSAASTDYRPHPRCSWLVLLRDPISNLRSCRNRPVATMSDTRISASGLSNGWGPRPPSAALIGSGYPPPRLISPSATRNAATLGPAAEFGLQGLVLSDTLPSVPLAYPLRTTPPQTAFLASHQIRLRYPYHFMASLRWIGISFTRLQLLGARLSPLALPSVGPLDSTPNLSYKATQELLPEATPQGGLLIGSLAYILQGYKCEEK